jgi:hypothetical protein
MTNIFAFVLKNNLNNYGKRRRKIEKRKALERLIWKTPSGKKEKGFSWPQVNETALSSGGLFYFQAIILIY